MAVTTSAPAKPRGRTAKPAARTVYRTLDGAIHHARCEQRMTYHGVKAGGLELEFYCARCHERVALPEIVAANLPVVRNGAA